MKYLNRPVIAFFIFLLIGFLLYGSALYNGFHYDDFHYVVNNPHIRNIGVIARSFTDPSSLSMYRVFAHYRPLLVISYGINYAFGGMEPAGYHLVNLVFHVGTAFLLFLLLNTMLEGIGFAALASGLLFLVHPFNSEVVNYISARSSVMVTFFYLLSFYLWVKYRENNSPAKMYYVMAIVTYFLAGMTKEVAVTLPIVFLLYDLYFKHFQRNKIRSYLPYIPIIIVPLFFIIGFRLAFFGSVVGHFKRDLWSQGLTATRVFIRYLLLWLYPMNLTVDYHMDPSEQINIAVIFATGIITLTWVIAYLLYRHKSRKAKIVSFFITWFFIVLLPTTMIPLNAIFQENRGYIAALALAVISGLALQQVATLFKSSQKGMSVSLAVLGVLIVAATMGVWDRNRIWKDDVSLWKDVISKSPQSVGGHVELGRVYANEGRLEDAEKEFLAALTINPDNFYSLNGLGVVYLRRGEIESAETYFRRAVYVSPENVEAQTNLVAVQAMQNKGVSESDEFLISLRGNAGKLEMVKIWITNRYYKEDRKVIEKDLARLGKKSPRNHAIHFAIGTLYRLEGDWRKAEESFVEAISLMPDEVPALLELATVRMQLNKWDNARVVLEKAKQIAPEESLVWQAWGVYYQRTGDYTTAIQYYKKAIGLNPNSYRTFNNIGTLYAEMRNFKEAVRSFQKALEIKPTYSEVQFNLGIVYEMQGKKDLAKLEYNKLIQKSPASMDQSKFLTLARRRLMSLK